MNTLQKTCLTCGKLFSKRYNESITNWNNKNRKYCSRECNNLAPRSKESRLKMRKAKLKNPTRYWKGKKFSEEYKQKLRKPHRKIKDTSNMCGKRPWNKIGDGITPINERIRKSPRYKRWVKRVFERDNYTCQSCGKRGGIILQAHHIKSFSKYPKLRFKLSNGKTLCLKCHRKTKSYGKQKSNSNKIE